MYQQEIKCLNIYIMYEFDCHFCAVEWVIWGSWGKGIHLLQYILLFHVIPLKKKTLYKCIFPLPFSPLVSPCGSPQLPHCCPCPWVLFPFCSIPPPPHLPPLSCHPALYLWVCPHFPCKFSLFIVLHIWVRSYGICLSPTGLFHLP